MTRIDPQPEPSAREPDVSPAARPSRRARLRAFLIRSAVLVAMVLLLGFVGLKVRVLWDEWSALRADRSQVEQTRVIGFEGIHPNISAAEHPADWFRRDGETTLLWSGWDGRSGHRWFRVGRDEVDGSRISNPMGRDVIPAIDWPIVEIGGGLRWGRIPEESWVVGLNASGVASAYPILLLSKVEIVNDEIGGRPLLVTFTPFVPIEEAIQVYNPILEGRRLTLGTSGYLLDGRPLLYDRGTESLWRRDASGLRAIAGPLKGAALTRVQHLTPTSWSSWRVGNPGGRLVVGADRSRAQPGT